MDLKLSGHRLLASRRAAITLFSAALASLVGVGPVICGTMSLPGSFSVNPTGAATYSIPIALPPGTAGMAPTLSLEYSSQGANGLLGVGWSLSGLPSITRCPQTMAQDGAAGSVKFDGNDRYCMDGQRLVVTSGAYGADGAQYRTEVETFSKIISHGSVGSGPAWFEVHTKSGQTMEFGNTADSVILAQGKTSARIWAVNKVSDTKTNYFTVTYNNDVANGQFYPTRIDYTGNSSSSTSPYNSVQFVYASRSDVAPSYQAGSLAQITVRLTDVKTYIGGTLVTDYRLAYTQSPSTQSSRLTSVTVCDSAGNCLPATTFSSQDGTTSTTSAFNNVEGADGIYIGWGYSFGDFNGDGKTDILWDNETGYTDGRSSGNRYLWISNGDGTFAVTTNLAGQDGSYIGWRASLADFNGDGKTDILWDYQGTYADGRSSGHRILWLSKGDGTFTIVGNLAGVDGYYIGWRAYLADFNGDGRADILWDYEDGYTDGRSSGNRVLWISNGDGTFAATSNLAGQDGYYIGWRASLIDVNGDGKTDILWDYEGSTGGYVDGRSSGTRILWMSNDAGTFTIISNVGGANGNYVGWRPLFADFNGDGKVDILWDNQSSYDDGRSSGNRILWLSKGDGTFAAIYNVAGVDGSYIGWRALLADFNGDGKADILWDNESSDGRSTGIRSLWLGKGDGSFVVSFNPFGMDGQYSGWRAAMADFNGDGKADALWDLKNGAATSNGGTIVDNRSQTQRALWLSDAVAPDLLTYVTNGVGQSTIVTYKPLTSNSVYTKGTTATYPVVDLQPPLSVVSRIDASNGVGGTYSSTYLYGSAKADLSGRGFLGFAGMSVRDLQTNITDTTIYRQDFPYIGLVASTTRMIVSQTLGQSTNTYQFSNWSGGPSVSAASVSSAPYKVSLSQNVSSGSDLDGSALPTVTTANQYDAYLNATQVTVSTPDGFSKTTTNTYTNDWSLWYLGRLTRATVANVAP